MFEFLLLFKLIIYTSIIEVEFNRILVILVSFLISVMIIAKLNEKSEKNRTSYILGFYIFISALMLINATYFGQFHNLTSVAVIKQIPQLKTVGDNLKILLDFKRMALIIDIPFVLYFLYKSRKEDKFNIDKYRKKYNKLILKTSVGLLSFSLIFAGLSGQLVSLSNQDIYIYHLKDIIKSQIRDYDVEARGITIDDLVKKISLRRELKDGEFTGIGRDKNLIVIQVEALQDFVINRSYLGQEITPNLNRLVNDSASIYFDNYFQLVGRGNTSDAEFVSQNSLHPSMNEPTYIQYGDNTFYGLPWLLRDNGYTSWVFHGYEREYWNRDNAYVNLGFERFIAEDNFQFEDIAGFGIKDEDFLSQSLGYIRELHNLNDNPFYAFLITLTSHTPFYMPQEDQHLVLLEEHVDTILGDYLQSIHYVDKELGKFIQSLEDEGIYEDTVIALYGDHFAISSTDEEYKELMTDFLGYEYDFDEMMNIPLMIHVPGEELGLINSNLGSQIDFYPTIANIMGYKLEKGIIFGQDLNNPTSSNYVFPQTYMHIGSVISKEDVFVVSKDLVFEHSSGFNRTTREPIDIEKYRGLNRKAIEEINISNYILENNIIREYVR